MIPGSRFAPVDREAERRRRAVEVRRRLDALRREVEVLAEEAAALDDLAAPPRREDGRPAEPFRLTMYRVGRIHGVTLTQLKGASRSYGIVAARMEIYWLGRVAHGLAFPVIGRLMNRDHTTVLHGVQEVDALMELAFGRHGEAALELPEDERRAAIVQRFDQLRRKGAQLNRLRTLARVERMRSDAAQAEARG